nr:T9SS type B sorting domain-containing protein [Flavobacterium sp. F-126]
MRIVFKSKQSYSFSLKIVLALFLVFFSFCSRGQQIICFGSVSNYGVDRSENLGLGTSGSVYNWIIKDSRFVGKILKPYNDRTNEISIEWKDTPPGDYLLEVNEKNDYCTGLSQILLIKILPLPFVNLPDQYLCVDPVTNQLLNPILIDTKLSNELYKFKWKCDGVTLPDIDSGIIVSKIGTYTVEITDQLTGCVTNDSSVVGKSSSAIASVKVNSIFFDIQDIIISVTNGIGNYEFSIDGINFQDDPSFSVSKSGIYQVVIRDKNGCNQIFLTANVIKYPKFFTPNEDGFNDVWKIDDLLPSMNPKISIFDRYGKLLKKINTIGEGWDGKYNGIDLFSDDYWFLIEYINTDGSPAVFRSHFSLKR